jgi:hypothetical protein
MQDKGHSEEMRLFAAVLRGDSLPPSSGGYLRSTEVALAALRSLESGGEVALNALGAQA